ncbi:MAG: PHP domain-containing protein [Candidatus Woesearchaeota archaeon]
MHNYDLHVHTHYSRCSNLSPKRILEVAKMKRLDGIAITDHNTIDGALEVKRLNKDKNFEVIIGEEVRTGKGEILAFYINEMVKPGPVEYVCRQVREQGGLVVPAHLLDPLRRHFSRQSFSDYAKFFDAVETLNGRTVFPFLNDFAFYAARRYGLASVAGSDAHFYYEIGSCRTLFNGSLRQALKDRSTSTKGFTLPGVFGAFHSVLYKRIAQKRFF